MCTVRCTMKAILVCIVVFFHVEISVGVTTSTLRMAEKTLIKKLLENYDSRSRPVVDGVTPAIERRMDENSTIQIQQITIQFGLRLVQILDLNEMDQVLTTSVRSLYEWTDYHLIWVPAENDGIQYVHIPTDKLWLPDIALYNYADERLEERRECAAKVHYNGTVEWHPMAIYKSACRIRIKFFPFDKQACRLKFGPWTYDGWRVNISYYHNMTEIDLTQYVTSPEWIIIGQTTQYTPRRYPCCPEPYPDISFYIWMERHPAFYTYILILPCFLLSSLTLVLFWLPPETPAKMVLGMNIFVAFFLLLLLLEDTTPSASSTFPLIGTYYCLNMGIITLSTFLSVIVVNFHFRGDNRKEVPYWLKKLAIYHGARLLLVNVTIKRESKPSQTTTSVQRANHRKSGGHTENLPLKSTGSAMIPGAASYNSYPYNNPYNPAPGQPVQQFPQNQRRYDDYAAGTSTRMSRGMQEFDEVLVQCVQRQKQRMQALSGEDLFPGGLLDPATRRRINMLTKDVQDIVKALRYIQKLNESKERVNKIVSEWRSVALVLDRLFFIIYVITIGLSIIFFFPKSGNDVEVGVIDEVQ